jgi:hypothetical protein
MSTETEADKRKVSFEYGGNGLADLTETEVDDGKDSFGDDEVSDLEADEGKDSDGDDEDSFGDAELADLAHKVRFKVKRNPASALRSPCFSSITSVARPDLEHETLSNHWIQKSKKESGSRNFLAKKMWQPFLHIVTDSKWTEYVFYTVLAIVIQVIFGRSAFFPDGGQPACESLNGMAVKNATMCDFKFALERGHSQLRVLVAFILSGFVAR